MQSGETVSTEIVPLDSTSTDRPENFSSEYSSADAENYLNGNSSTTDGFA